MPIVSPIRADTQVPIDDIALVVAPIEEQRYLNDPDLCGHYFFPYEMAEGMNAAFGGFEVDKMAHAPVVRC